MSPERIPVNKIVGMEPITFLDMKEREEQERARLENERYLLAQQRSEDGKLPPDQEARLKKITEMLKGKAVVDPLFRSVRDALDQMGYQRVGDHVDGRLPSQVQPNKSLSEDEQALAAVYGVLSADNMTNPELGERATEPGGQLRIGERFFKAVAAAVGEYTADKQLFDRVLQIVASEGLKRSGDAIFRVARTNQVVTVARDLDEDGVTHDDEQLALQVRVRLSNQLAASETAVPSAISIDLPDLEAQADLEIVADNIRAMQAIYFAAMLEEMRVFQVMDKLQELFQNGMLTFGRGPAGDAFFAYWKKSVNRLTEVERRNIYARTLGMPGGDPMIQNPNREFNDLFLRTCSAVSSFVRQFKVDDLLRSTIPFRVSTEHVRKSARDLAANLSLYGYGIAHYAATELQGEIKDIISILSQEEVKMAYGARDMWQVIDQVATLELGGARNGIRYRTMATSGAIVIRWLAERANVLAAGYGTDILNMSELRRPTPRPAGHKPTTHPTDRDLVDAVEQYLAVTGVSEARVEEYAQPSEGPATPSRPIAIPQVARELLDSVGISAGYQPVGAGYGNGYGNGHGNGGRIPSNRWG